MKRDRAGEVLLLAGIEETQGRSGRSGSYGRDEAVRTHQRVGEQPYLPSREDVYLLRDVADDPSPVDGITVRFLHRFDPVEAQQLTPELHRHIESEREGVVV